MNPSSTPSPAPRPRFLWQPALILLPVLALTVVGLLSLRQDRALADQEARERAGRLAQGFADRAFAPIFTLDPLIQTNTLVAPGVDLLRPVWELSAAGEQLLWPPPVDASLVPRPLDAEQLAPAARAIWESARRAVASAEWTFARGAWADFLATAPPGAFETVAQFELAQAEARTGATNEAQLRFRQIAKHQPDVLGESGLPLAPLAHWRAAELQLLDAATNEERQRRLPDVCSNVVFHPTLLTPLLLQRAFDLAEAGPKSAGDLPSDSNLEAGDLRVYRESKTVSAWWQLWETTQLSRQLFAATSREWERLGLLATNQSGAVGLIRLGSILSPLWVHAPPPTAAPRSDLDCASGDWLITRWPPSSLRFHARTECEISNMLRLVREQVPDMPAYFDVSFNIAGRTFPVSSAHALLAERAAANSTQPGDPEPLVTASIYLSDPAALYARQRQRTWWFLALVLAAATTAGIGLVSAHRAFHRQLRLNEMKSNFVSSVSHELRAPIASVRLLAESLDRGKITDEAKRRDYFRLIGQECRRLSSLIENVLDFSRIDQGRKQYELEPTDVAALVRQTVELMRPYAAERDVRLELVTPSSLEVQPSVDGKALQQALVNLIDNAVKHSPSGAAVQIALELPSQTPAPASPGAASRAIALSVADQGPGIPASEHERIFEPFHRLGSELRRETTGVGIGLSIVRHIVKGHGGRVRVESEVGRGSRFVIELPADEARSDSSP